MHYNHAAALRWAQSYRKDVPEILTKTDPQPHVPVPVRPTDDEFKGFENLLNTEGRLWVVEEWFKGEAADFHRPSISANLYEHLALWNIRPGYTYWFCSEYARWKAKKVWGE